MAKYRLVLAQSKSESNHPPPMARSGHRCATDGVFLYAFGGYNPNSLNKLFYENIWCFHMSSNTWYRIHTASYAFRRAPTSVASSAMLFLRGEFIVFGGSGYPFGMNNSNDIFICNPCKQRWHCYSFMNENGQIVPTPGYGQGSVIGSDNCMYVFGGTKGLVYNNDLYKFDFVKKSWEFIECRNPPSARYRHEMVGIEDGFIVIGGYGTSGACSLDKLPLYSYTSCSWKEVRCTEDSDHGFPQPRRAHSCVKYKDNVYICGGFDEETSSGVFNDIWRLNVRTFSWFKIPQVLPQPTYFHSAAVTGEGCMYMFGGIELIDGRQEERTNNVLRMWLVIPSLLNLCWQRLCDTVPLTRKLHTERLRQFCVPKHLLANYDAQFKVGLKNDML